MHASIGLRALLVLLYPVRLLQICLVFLQVFLQHFQLFQRLVQLTLDGHWIAQLTVRLVHALHLHQAVSGGRFLANFGVQFLDFDVQLFHSLRGRQFAEVVLQIGGKGVLCVCVGLITAGYKVKSLNELQTL